MAKRKNLLGQRFGKLIVAEETDELEDRYAVWVCKCDCGNTCKVNTKRLCRGTVTNCGCVPRDDLNHGSRVADLTGMNFGKLTALYRTENRNGRTAWHCRCSCGNEVDVTTHELRAGKTKSCGCNKLLEASFRDIKGMRFGRLSVCEKLPDRDSKCSVLWRCVCECGAECICSGDNLVSGNITSCGCRKREYATNALKEKRTLVDGTCIELLLRTKARSDSGTGIVGVYALKNGKFRASISLQGKRYWLGTYSTIEEAIAARKEGEKIHQDFIDEFRNKQSEKTCRE